MAHLWNSIEYDAHLHIDVAAILRNYRRLSGLASPARCAAVVKADCYGLGAADIAPALRSAGARDFFVATLAEGKRLRRLLGGEVTIFILNGVPAGSEEAAAEYGLVPVLNTLAHCRNWARMGYAAAALQVDTGMSRLGLSPAEVETVLGDATLRSQLNLVLLMSHLADADDEPNGAMDQLSHFTAARKQFPGIAGSLANSAGIFLGPAFHQDLVRPGAALYGIETGNRATGVEAVVRLDARIVQTRSIAAGASVGYGYSFTATHDMQLATIGVGYADGWPRHLSGCGAAWFDGIRLPAIGRVSMDSFVVDISALPPDAVDVGSSVELIGQHQSVDDVARAAGTIGYEVLTRIGARFATTYFADMENAA